MRTPRRSRIAVRTFLTGRSWRSVLQHNVENAGVIGEGARKRVDVMVKDCRSHKDRGWGFAAVRGRRVQGRPHAVTSRERFACHQKVGSATTCSASLDRNEGTVHDWIERSLRVHCCLRRSAITDRRARSTMAGLGSSAEDEREIHFWTRPVAASRNELSGSATGLEVSARLARERGSGRVLSAHGALFRDLRRGLCPGSTMSVLVSASACPTALSTTRSKCSDMPDGPSRHRANSLVAVKAFSLEDAQQRKSNAMKKGID
jgi:hypothetical protein